MWMKDTLKLKEVAEQKDARISELEIHLSRNLEKIKTLEANKTYLMNENTILKNEMKATGQKKHQDEEQRSKTVPEKTKDQVSANDEQEKIRKELDNLRGDLKQFKEYPIRRFDNVSERRGSRSSSAYITSSSEDEEAAQNSSAEVPQQHINNREVPHRRKLWDNTGREIPRSLRFEGNNSKTMEDSPDEQGRRKIPVVPGPKTYSDTVRCNSAPPGLADCGSQDFTKHEKLKRISDIRRRREARESKTLVFSSSITRDIKKQSFNSDCKGSDVAFHEFRGKKAKDIVRYMTPHLDDECPSNVVLIAGGNDLPDRDIPSEEVRKVANCLLEGGLRCREQYGVKKVFISSILPRSNSQFQGNRHRLNIMLKEMCHENQITFIDNNNIVLRQHGHRDGVHLNEEGSDMLCANLLNVLND